MQEDTVKKLTDSEMKIMEVLWRNGDCPARSIAEVMEEQQGWNINSTYTLIKRCIHKGAVARTEPGFLCHALLERDEVRQSETSKILNRLFDGSAELMFATLLGSQKLTQEEIRRMKKQLEELESEE